MVYGYASGELEETVAHTTAGGLGAGISLFGSPMVKQQVSRFIGNPLAISGVANLGLAALAIIASDTALGESPVGMYLLYGIAVVSVGQFIVDLVNTFTAGQGGGQALRQRAAPQRRANPQRVHAQSHHGGTSPQQQAPPEVRLSEPAYRTQVARKRGGESDAPRVQIS